MAPPGINVDDAENVRRFVAQMRGLNQGSTGINPSTASSTPEGSTEMPSSSQSRAINTAHQGLNGIARGPLSESTTLSELRSRAGSLTDDQFRTAMHDLTQSSRGTTSATNTSPLNALAESSASTAVINHGRTNEVLHHQSNPIDIPPRVSSSDHTPLSGSPDLHPHPSPNEGGLAPPYNTPQTRASSPHFGPNNTHNEDVADALAEWVEGLEGRPLSESMWAPKNGYPPSLLSGLRPGSRNLTPIGIVQPNLAINDSFGRMSSRAANSHSRIGGNIIGEHNVRPSRLPANAPPRAVPAAPLFASLETDKSDSKSQSTLPAPDIKVTDFVNTTTKKESMSASTNKTASVPPHLRGKDVGTQPSEDSCTSGMDHTTESLTNDLTEVEPFTTSPEPLRAAPQTEIALKLKTQADKGSSSVATGTSDSLDETGQKLIWHIEAIESSGYLSAETLTSLRGVSDSILAYATGRTKDNYLLPAKTYQDPARSIQKQLATSLIETANEATVKAGATEVSTPKADNTNLAGKLLDKWVTRTKQPSTPQSNAPSPTTPISPAGLSSAEVRKILTNAPASPAQTPSNAPGSLAIAESAAIGQTTPAAPSPSTSTKSGITVKADSLPSAVAAGRTNAVGDSRENTEDQQHKTYFATWGKQEVRDRPVAKVRKVIIKNLPHYATATFVAGLVYGGAIEEIHIRSSAAGDLTAAVRFMNAKECMQYYDETSNGIVYKKDSQNREMVVYVDLAKDVDVIGGMLRNWIENGFTRCVRAVGVNEDWDLGGLEKIAERKGRKIESIHDGKNAGGARSVVFRFCKIEDAVQFKNALVRDDEWEQCNIHFAHDPCATATGLHFDN